MITVMVTAEDIKRGLKEHCSFCPLALAWQRATHNKLASVGYYRAYLDDEVFNLPDAAVFFHCRFDQNRDLVQPEDFVFFK